jgi:hypothetical protein
MVGPSRRSTLRASYRLMAQTELDQITEWGFVGGCFLAQPPHA